MGSGQCDIAFGYGKGVNVARIFFFYCLKILFIIVPSGKKYKILVTILGVEKEILCVLFRILRKSSQ